MKIAIMSRHGDQTQGIIRQAIMVESAESGFIAKAWSPAPDEVFACTIHMHLTHDMFVSLCCDYGVKPLWLVHPPKVYTLNV